MGKLRQLGSEARGSSPAVILVLASLFSAVAAVLELTAWVAIAAAVAALLSGIQVLRTELFIPMCIKAAENSTVMVAGLKADGRWLRGTASQIADNRWATAHHTVRDCSELVLRIGGEPNAASIVYEDEVKDIAVLRVVDTRSEWKALPMRSIPDSGEKVRIVGWAARPHGHSLRLSFDYTIQGPADNNSVAMTGEGAQLGFSGAPAIDLRTGRVFGLFTEYSRPEHHDKYLPEPLAVVLVRPIISIPPEALRDS